MTLTEAVNSGDNLVLGSCCASKIEFSLLDLDLALTGLVGEEFAYRLNGELKGYFTAEKPEKLNDSGWKLTCYDRMVKFDQPVNDWFEELTYPITLKDLLVSLCGFVGVELATQSFTNDAYLVSDNFSGKDIKGRDFLYWIAEAAGSFARINAEGKLELGFYTESAKTIDRTKYQAVTVADYATRPIDKLQIKYNDDDVGVITGTGTNCYMVKGNPLFYTRESESIRPAAEALLAKIEGFTYTPFECQLIAGSDLPEAGEYVSITTRRESNIRSVVMEKVTTGLKTSVSSKGDAEENTLESVNKTILMQNGRTNELERTLEKTMSRVSDTYTKDETNTMLESRVVQTAGEILAEVNETYTTKNQMNELGEELEDIKQKSASLSMTVDGLEASVSVRGGDNLITNSSGVYGMYGWKEDSSAAVKESSALSSGHYFSFESDKLSLEEGIRVVPGAKYSIYCKYRADIASGGSVTLVVGNEVYHLTENSSWKELSATFTAVQSPVDIEIIAVNASVDIGDLMLSEGLETKIWRQAPNETKTGAVTIYGAGIQIDDSESDLKGTYTNERVEYIRKSDKTVVARFSSAGAETGKLDVTGTLTVQKTSGASHALRIIPASDHVMFVIND